MNRKNQRYVEGLRVIKKYNPSILFSGLLAMVVAALPAIFLFLPWLNFSTSGVQIATSSPELDFFTTEFALQLSGLDLIKYLFGLSSDAGKVIEFASALDKVTGFGFYAIIGKVLIYGAAGTLLFLYFLCALELLIGFFTMLRGKKRKTKTMFNFSVWIFIFSLLMAAFSIGICIGMNYGYSQVAAKASGSYAGVNIGLTYLIAVVGGTFFTMILLGIFYLAGLRKVVFKDDVIFEGEEVKNFLGREVTEIPDKAFNKNLALEIAEIPNGIPSLGNSAFANCVNLKVVEIPASVTKIGYNCFFNCCKLNKIVYHGSKIQWRKIQRGSNWLTKAKTNLVICDDGTLIVDPTK